MARSYLSLLINTSNLNNLLRLETMTKLSLDAMCVLSAKTFDEEIMVRSVKIIIRGRRSVKIERK